MSLYSEYARQRVNQGPHDVSPDDAEALRFVREARIGDGWLHPQSSNYTFVVELTLGQVRGFGVYKPSGGETPLWDFPNGTLYLRECAAYELSRALSWPIVPPTVIREGEAGAGSVQLFVPPKPGSNFFTMRDDRRDELIRFAVFDVLANNADRKGGHCFATENGSVWGVDHGLTFHEERKLRTVIWDYAGEQVPDALMGDLTCLLDMLGKPDSEVSQALAKLLRETEIGALRDRLCKLIDEPVLPSAYSRRDLPWPWL